MQSPTASAAAAPPFVCDVVETFDDVAPGLVGAFRISWNRRSTASLVADVVAQDSRWAHEAWRPATVVKVEVEPDGVFETSVVVRDERDGCLFRVTRCLLHPLTGREGPGRRLRASNPPRPQPWAWRGDEGYQAWTFLLAELRGHCAGCGPELRADLMATKWRTCPVCEAPLTQAESPRGDRPPKR